MQYIIYKIVSSTGNSGETIVELQEIAFAGSRSEALKKVKDLKRNDRYRALTILEVY